MSYGKRYSDEEREKILEFRKTHTYKETMAAFGISQMTLFRWESKATVKPDDSELTTPDAQEDINVLIKVVKFLEGVKAVALVAASGKPIASELDPGLDEYRVLALTAAFLAVTERAGNQLGFELPKMILANYETGTFMIVGAGPKAALVVIFDALADFAQIIAPDLGIINRVKEEITALL
jgi:hypothetical protein